MLLCSPPSFFRSHHDPMLLLPIKYLSLQKTLNIQTFCSADSLLAAFGSLPIWDPFP